MLLLRSFLFASFVPLGVVLICAFRLWQETGALPPGVLMAPFERLAAGGLVEAARSGGDTAARLSLVYLASLGLAVVSFASFLFALLISAVVGKNRVAMVAVLPVFALGMLLVTTAFVIGDVLALLGVVWTFAAGDHAAVTANGFSFWTILLLGVGILTVLGLVSALIRMFHVPAMDLLGVEAQAPDHSKILAFVEDVARKIDARPPQHVVLGMDLNFFATNAPVNPNGKGRLRGETLYLSLPCLRLLSEGELRAVIGHELGHFSGKDTRFSMAFAPLFFGLGSAVQAVQRPLFGRIPNLLGWGAAARLFYVLVLFRHNQGAVSREREFAADQKGAEASSPTDLAASLIKMYIFSEIWTVQGEINRRRLRRGRFTRNLSWTFAERVRYDAQHMRLPELVKDSLNYATAHPTDQHPPTSDRIRELNVMLASVAGEEAIAQRLVPERAAAADLDDMRFIEEQLTQRMQHFWIAQGVHPREEEAQKLNFINFVNNVFCQIFAHMVLADHNLDDREIEAAENQAVELVPDFDRDGFREFCRNENALVPLDTLLQAANQFLDDDGKQFLLKLLSDIAKADRKVVPEEIAVFGRVKAALGG
jgi:Zn-dependent protease with chaperone function